MKVKTEEQKNKWNEYQRKYRVKNPDKMKLYKETYIIRKASELLNEQNDKEKE